MHERDLLPILLATLLLAPLLARWVGLRVAAHQRPVPGRGRDWMPSLPETPPIDGTPGGRFEASVRKLERWAVADLLPAATHGVVREVTAEGLAGRAGVAVEVATALLDEWRRRLRCRLRVTRGGELRHDFPATDIASAARTGWHAWPQRVALWVAAVLANVGATWWVVVGVLTGVASLTAVWRARDDMGRLQAAAVGIGAIVAVFLVSQLGAWAVQFFAWRRHPRMDVAARGPDGAVGRRLSRAPRTTRNGASLSDTTSSSGDSWLSGLSFDVDGEGCVFLLAAAAIAVVVAIVLGGLAVVGIWLRGLWHAARHLGEPARDIGPARWLREARRVADWERWVPTNDLAIRLVRALNRAFVGRPGDERIGPQVLGRAKAQQGRVSAAEISLDFALDPSEALSVGTRLMARLGGDIEVSDAGEIDFVLPPEALASAEVPLDNPDTEYLGDNPERPLRPERLAVNVPGLTRDHVDGAMRLAGGPYATVAVMAAALAGGRGDLPIQGLDLGLGAVFCVLAPGTLILAVAARQAVAEHARQGILRDVRRLAACAVKRAMEGRGTWLSASALAETLAKAVAALGLGWDQAALLREVEAMWTDLGMEPQLDGPNPGDAWSLRPLRDRRAALAALRADAAAGNRTATQAAATSVVFDSGGWNE
ncbi:MAG: hypothetical protein EXR79_07920 [Myxococcales bacterium]|nr:hypothetical protein [Myxococcales bacterium]